MYKKFYKLNCNPFSLTADASFVFETKSFIKAFRNILYGIEQMEGIVAVTGEVGTGKTTLCNFVIENLNLESSDTICHVLFSDPLFIDNNIKNIYTLLPAKVAPKTAADFRNELITFSKNGEKIILIIDEADKLSVNMLRNISLLSNMERHSKKLIQIVFVGEPELSNILLKDELKQLNQRITVRYKLRKLTIDETEDYIYHRLKIAGDNGSIRFTAKALSSIYNYTKGCQRLTNLVCDRSLLIGKKENVLRLNPLIIYSAIKSLNIENQSSFHNSTIHFKPMRILTVSVCILLAVFTVITVYKNYTEESLVKESITSAGLPAKDMLNTVNYNKYEIERPVNSEDKKQ